MVNRVLRFVLGMGLFWFLIMRLIMQIEVSKQEAWKLLDAIKSYMKDYTVTTPVSKTFSNIIKKLEIITNS